VRPYLSEEHKPAPKPAPIISPAPAGENDLRQRIRSAVKAQLGDQVDEPLLEAIITRVLNNVGVR
jgi:citrate lyase gamma subunit